MLLKSDNIIEGQELGKGLNSIVFQACIINDINISTSVALKKYKEEAEEFFEQEKQIHLSLKHPHIIELLYTIEKPESPYYGLVLEIAIHGTLEDYFNRKCITEHVCLRILSGFFAGLTYLHEQFIIHADIKMRNILLVDSPDGIVGKLSDFSSSMRMDAKKMKCTVDYLTGTSAYRAPELLEGMMQEQYDYSPASDMWAAGVVLQKVMNAVKSASPTRSPQLHAFVERCKKIEPKERPSAREGKEIMDQPQLKLW